MYCRHEDTRVSVERNDEKVCHRCIGQSVIKAQPNITHCGYKRPVTDQCVHAIQKYGDKTNSHVNNRQTH
ncbi:hypothetical protein DPMN_146142 [Dreissena polymorpha]|uniref:Uncharacterized protein n=1 Tax=Dreissena polymorpha TaxID=45954 RepID=A0A9D4F9T3_DREPO|nr:hypothetical protein DPMN_146142 [Dreissena polymorpha]